MDQLAQIVSTVGFPIVAAGAMFWYVNKQGERYDKESKNMENALNENTKVLEGLKELIAMLVNKVNGDE